MNMIANDPSFQQEGMDLSRVEYAYRKIKNNVTTNIYPSGFQILEPDLAKKLGISRTPVREALIRLEADKLIQLIPRRGMRVNALNVRDIGEIAELLVSLFRPVVDLICSEDASVDLNGLEKAFDVFASHSRSSEKYDWVSAEEEIFIALASSTSNVRLKLATKNFLEQLRRPKMVALNYSDDYLGLHQSLIMLVSALKEKQVARAGSALRLYREVLVSILHEVQSKYQLKEF